MYTYVHIYVHTQAHTCTLSKPVWTNALVRVSPSRMRDVHKFKYQEINIVVSSPK